MYRAVIIDDEPIIVEGLTRILPWKRWDCQVTATAENGLEGQKIIREYQPDIVFSDIAMPGQDGLQMVAALKSEFENMEITILTGYRDFDYAREAIRLGVTRYLLKPSAMKELEEAMDAMTANLRKKNILPASQEESAAGSFIVNKAITYLKEHYAEKITLPELADRVFVSQWHLSKLINRHTGQNFSDLLGSIRIENAKKLMEDPALRISDIAELVGFQDAPHFSKVFKKQEGISANEYRNRTYPGAR